MQRTIKFRAFDKNTAEMIAADDWYFGEELEPFVDMMEQLSEDFALMQYTGMKDKHGAEIYEGDILLIPDEYTDPMPPGSGKGYTTQWKHSAPVSFENGSFGVTITDPADIFHRKGFWAFPLIEAEMGGWPDEIEIVGNIHENPELLTRRRSKEASHE